MFTTTFSTKQQAQVITTDGPNRDEMEACASLIAEGCKNTCGLRALITGLGWALNKAHIKKRTAKVPRPLMDLVHFMLTRFEGRSADVVKKSEIQLAFKEYQQCKPVCGKEEREQYMEEQLRECCL